MPSEIPSPSTILRYETRHDFTRSIEDPDTVRAWREAISTGNLHIVVEGRCFKKVEFLANGQHFDEVDAPPLTLWQRFVRLIAGDRLRAHLEQAIDTAGAPTFMGPVARWSERDAAALRRKIESHHAILNYPLHEPQHAALYHLKFHTRGIDRKGADLLFCQKQFDAQALNFRRSLLKGIDLRHRNLQRTILNESDLSAANLSGADLRAASLRGARLRRAILDGAQVEDADLRGADLREADLRGLDLTSANLEGVKLRGARLEGATLGLAQLLTLIDQGVDVRGAKVRWRKERPLPDDGKHLRKLMRAGVDLSGADLHGLDLRGFKFKPASLKGVNLKGALLQYADLRRVQLSGVDLCGANLARVRLGYRTLAGARLDRAALATLEKRPLTRGLPGMEEEEARELAALLEYARTYDTEAEQEAAFDSKLPPHLPTDLSGVDLHGEDLSGFDFGFVNLVGANLSGTTLEGANLSGANLAGAVLPGAKEGRERDGAELRRTQPDSAPLDHANQDRTVGPRSSLPEVDLEEAAGPGARRSSDTMVAAEPLVLATRPSGVAEGGKEWPTTPGGPQTIVHTSITVSAVA